VTDDREPLSAIDYDISHLISATLAFRQLGLAIHLAEQAAESGDPTGESRARELRPGLREMRRRVHHWATVVAGYPAP
jgi:hypothetical protein